MLNFFRRAAAERRSGGPGAALATAAVGAWLVLHAAAAGGAAPQAPEWTAVLLVKGGTSVGLRWSPVGGAASYRLWRRAEPGAPFEPLATVEDVQFFDAALRPGESRTYRVQAIGPAGEGPLSEERTVSLPAPAPARPADAPTWSRTRVVAFEQREGPPRVEVQLFWRRVVGALGYRVLRREEGAAEFSPLGFYGNTGLADRTVADGGTYEYAVVSLNENLEESSPSVVRRIHVDAGRPDQRVPPTPPPPAALAAPLWETHNVVPDRAPGGRARLADPFDLACDPKRDRLYVTSTTDRHVVVLRASDGAPVATIGPAVGEVELARPLGIGLDAGGNLLVADAGLGAVLVVSPDGALLRRIALSGKGLAKEPRPADVAAHPDGRIFVSDAANAQVAVLTSRGWEADRWGSPKRGEPLRSVGALAISPEGEVIVADGAAGRIRVFTTGGTPRAAYGARGPGDNEFLFLGGVAALGDGSILASDVWTSGVTVFGRLTGPLLLAADRAAAEPRPVGLLGPVNIASDGKDRLFVAEAIANRVTGLRVSAAEPPPRGRAP